MKKGELLSSCEYLKQLPSSVVFKYFLENNEVERKILSGDIIDSISKEFFCKEALETRFLALSTEAQKVCALAYLFGGIGIRAMEFNDLHEQLLSSFLVYAAHDQQGVYYYFGFKDIEPHIRDVCSRLLYHETATTQSFQSHDLTKLCCLQDFTNILIAAFKGTLKRKQDGDLIQITYTELRNRLHVNRSMPGFTKKEKDTRRVVKFLIAFGIHLGLIVEEDKMYRSSITAIEKWLAYPLQDGYQKLIDFTLLYLGAWNVDLMNTLFNQNSDAWLTTKPIPLSCKEHFSDVLTLFYYLGLLEVEGSGKELYFRRVPCGEVPPDHCLTATTDDSVVISSDFTALLPREAQPPVLHRFSLLGSIVKLDQVYKGKVDRENICESMSRGIDGNFLILTLTQWHAPENVIETIKEWIREFSRLYVVYDTTIMVFDQKAGNQIGQYGPLAEFIENIEPISVFKIKKGAETRVSEILREMGFDSRMPLRDLPTPALVELPQDLHHDTDEELALAIDFSEKIKTLSHKLKSGKYSEDLKELDKSELYHVVDYAILMGYTLKFEYEGSPYIRQGIYSILPKKLINGKDPVIEGSSDGSTIMKRFYLKKIKKIGVLSV